MSESIATLLFLAGIFLDKQLTSVWFPQLEKKFSSIGFTLSGK